MTTLLILVLGAVAAFGLWLAYRSRRERMMAETFQMMAAAGPRRPPAEPRKPEIGYAARGFTEVYAARMARPGGDLHALEYAVGERMLDQGASELQALSTRWGGVCAIHVEPHLVQAGLDTYDDAVRKQGAPANAQGDTRELTAASLYLTLLITTEPDEFERFLNHLGR